MTCFGDVNMSELKMSPGFCLRNLVTLTFNQHNQDSTEHIHFAKENLTTSFSMGRCGVVVGNGCCGDNHIITFAVQSISTGSTLGFHTSEGGKEKPRDTLIHILYKNQTCRKPHKTKKKHHTSHISLCRSCLVVWIRCWGSSHSIF